MGGLGSGEDGISPIPCGSGMENGCINAQAASSGDLAQVATRVRGPIIIGEFDTTIVAPPDFQVMRDPFFNVVLTRIGAPGAAADRSTTQSQRRCER